MAFNNQSGSWNSEGNFSNQNPQSNQGVSPCYACTSTCHTLSGCPKFKRMIEEYEGNRERPTSFNNPATFEPKFQGYNWNNQSFNQWENQDSSFQGFQYEPSPYQGNFQMNDNASPSSNSKLGQQVADLQAELSRTKESLSSLSNLFFMRTDRHDREIDQQAERISAMEQAQSKSDEVIKAQTEKIKSLEDTVKTLENRLKSQQHEQTHQHAANLRRIKQLNVEVPHLRQDLESNKTWLCRMQKEQYAVNCVVKEMVTKNESYTGFPNPNKEISSCRVEPFKDMDYDSDSSDDDFQAACEQLWGHIQGHLNGEKSQQLKENAQKQMDRTSPTTLKENSQQDVQIERPGKTRVIDSSWMCNRFEADTSCSGCGLNCEDQLRACVNMIKVQPSLTKVEEMEIKSMKSKQKRKLQRKWVPRGTFDIKELCKIDSILSELKCIQQVLPRVKKRQRKPPDSNDSHD